MTSSDGFSYQTPSADAAQKLELNQEQLHALLNKLSSDEQKELTEMMRTCTSEVTMTRGLPITGAVLGSLYFARTRLPAQYHFGPKGWPFYAIMGIASLTASNLLFMGTCRDRIKPRIDQLWRKYDLAKSTTNYDEIRRQNRGAAPGAFPSAISAEAAEPRAETRNPYDYTYSLPEGSSASGESFTTYKPLIGETSEFSQAPGRPRRPIPSATSPFAADDTFISGTPSGPSSGKGTNDGYTFS
ncbi:unnamed protein product [Caenorhabditis sp. 36 PRJEB53466]|nr:unnamed protein product [Caenorhabditis sp. 36 PRJEB53466]